MVQNTHFVNCPGCGKLLEVVCPMHDRKVIKVWAVKRRFLRSFDYVNTSTACSQCGMNLRVYWDFD